MTGDPVACRLQARLYVRLAQEAIFPQHRAHFAGLARSWLQLAKMFESGIRQSDRGDGKVVELAPRRGALCR